MYTVLAAVNTPVLVIVVIIVIAAVLAIVLRSSKGAPSADADTTTPEGAAEPSDEGGQEEAPAEDAGDTGGDGE